MSPPVKLFSALAAVSLRIKRRSWCRLRERGYARGTTEAAKAFITPPELTGSVGLSRIRQSDPAAEAAIAYRFAKWADPGDSGLPRPPT